MIDAVRGARTGRGRGRGCRCRRGGDDDDEDDVEDEETLDEDWPKTSSTMRKRSISPNPGGEPPMISTRSLRAGDDFDEEA